MNIRRKKKIKSLKNLPWRFDKREQTGKQTFWPHCKQSMEVERRKKQSRKLRKSLSKRNEEHQKMNESKFFAFDFKVKQYSKN